MKKNFYTILFFVLFCIFFVLSLLQYKKIVSLESELEQVNPSEKKVWAKKQDCQTNETYYRINGSSMEPLIKDKSKVKVIENYYDCHPTVQRWDIIIYETLATRGTIIKQVRALPWDKIHFDEKGRLYINWKKLTNSVGKEYVFNKQQQQNINRYVKNGKLQTTSFLAFGDNVSRSDDSRRLWWLGIEYFEWKVILE